MTSDAPTGTQGLGQQHDRSGPGGPSPTGPRVADASTSAQPIVIDCDACSVRGHGCGDCLVTVLLGGPPEGVVLDGDERRAVEALAGAGLIPPLRMVQSVDSVQVVGQ